MKSNETKEALIARLLLNTRRRNRPDSIVQIANSIIILEKQLGSLKRVAETIGISVQMLRKFLSVNGLVPQVRKYVRTRKIDSVAIIDILRRFKPENQKVIAGEIMQGNLSLDNMKVLSALSKSHPQEDIRALISRVRESENKKIYVIKFKTPKTVYQLKDLKKKIDDIVGPENVVFFDISNSPGIIELTNAGRKNIIRAAKNRGLSLKQFVTRIIDA